MKKVNEEWILQMVKEMTLDEKIGMIHGNGLFQTKGVSRLGIPSLKSSDGPMGVRNEFRNAEWKELGYSNDYVSYLPSNAALASTWNRDRAYDTGSVLGAEARGRGKDVILAPGINIKRSPLCGRNFEYMSEDPYLTGEIAKPFVKGIQEQDVAACVKHFAVNSQERNRLWVDTIVDEQTLQEIYFPAFKATLTESGAYSVMGAYNKVNGFHCCENHDLLNRVLRDEWGYDGVVISDWGGVHLTDAAATASLDVEMSVTANFDEYYLANPLKKKIEQGQIAEEFVDQKVKNILRLMLRLNMIGEARNTRKAGAYNTMEHQQATRKTAQEGMVLLKNAEGALPLKKENLHKVGVIGYNANRAQANGGGSAEIKALYEITPLMGITKELGGNAEVIYHEGYYVPERSRRDEINWQEATLDFAEELEHLVAGKELVMEDDPQAEQKREQLRLEAIALAKECDHVIFVGGLDHGHDVEGSDRKTMKLPYEQDKIIDELLKVCPDMTIVLLCGSPVSVSSFAQKAKAILWMSYSGMEGGTALADLLFGNVSPTGRLAETWPVSYEDCGTFTLGEFGKLESVTYYDRMLVGYRYYDTKQVAPMYPFGYGLSYCEIAWNDVAISKKSDNGKIDVKVSLTNKGDIETAEVIQVYLSEQAKKDNRPLQELKAFEKVFLKAGETKEVYLSLDEKSFSQYNPEAKEFTTFPGNYTVRVGASSRDIKKEVSIVW